jgi:hypothetical protein
MNGSADELRNLTLALLANAKALQTAGKAARDGLQAAGRHE